MPLARPVDQWPLMLCGPILRRVTRNSVAVFIATSQSCQVTLEIHPGTGPPSTLGSGQRTTMTLGERLHVTVVEAENLNLQPGVIYTYDLRLAPTGGAAATLSQLGLLAEPYRIGYDLSLPSFSLPANVFELTIAYGSCRKPHGENRDAFPLVERMIDRDRRNPGRRPHLLILGGDQIYADDVAVPLLEMIREVVPILFGPNFTETLPGVTNNSAFGFDDLPPGLGRRDFVNKVAALTAGVEKPELVDAHLLFFAEYCAMYLFQWSDALWPQNPALLRHFNLVDFVRLLPRVRRALANVPTLMIFDDHDVTDDWNLNRAWDASTRVSRSRRRVVRNALSAYAIFQDWGNAPGKYVPDPPSNPSLAARILLTIGQDRPLPFPEEDLDAAFDLQLPRAAPDRRVRWDWLYEDVPAGYQVIGLDTRTWRGFPPNPSPSYAEAGLIATDPALDNQQLENSQPLGFQLLARRPTDNRLTIIVSATPVFGNPYVELGVDWWILRSSDPSAVRESFDNETWAGNRIVFEDLLRRLAGFSRVVILSGDVHYGFTVQGAWWSKPAAGARTSGRIIQLCSSACHNEDTKTRVLNGIGWALCGPQLGWLGFRGPRPLSVPMLNDLAVLGLPGPRRGRLGVTLLQNQISMVLRERFKAPCVLPDRHYRSPQALSEIQALVGPPGNGELTDWRYMLTYATDDRDNAQYLRDAGLADDLLSVWNHWSIAILFRAIVGSNNVGRVRFKPDRVVHELHWWFDPPNGGQSEPMFTRHRVSLDPPTGAEMPIPIE